MTNYDSIKYKKSFLNQVIMRLDFLQFAPTNQVFANDIDKSILNFFPRRGMDQIIRFNEINFVIGPNTPLINNTQGDYLEGIQREYYSLNQKNKLILSNKFLIFEINNYSDFEELQLWLHSIVNPFFLKNQLTVVRTGIRYINIFDSKRIKIRKNMFSPEIASIISTKRFQETKEVMLIRSMNVTEYQVNGMHLNFRYGLFNPQYPNPFDDNSFALDYDCYTEEPIEAAEDILRCIEIGHNAIQMSFESSITDSLRKVMHNE